MNSVLRNRVFGVGVLLALVFWTLTLAVPLDALIIVLNGVLFGSLAAIGVAYGPLLVNTALGQAPYDRVRQMTLGFFACWVAVVFFIFSSAYSRAAGFPPPSPNYASAAGRFIAIGAAVLQVTAPDFGLGIFHGRDRKTLWSGLAVGVVIALIVIYMQDQQVLKPEHLAGLIRSICS